MPKQTPYRVSVIVPCYNEEDYIVSCLSALTHQSVKPYEIIVVDNNSTDKTAQLAKSFKGVILINESRQGVMQAHSRGMNTARGDIIARVDADSVAAPDWVETISKYMVDPEIMAITGTGNFYDYPCKRFIRITRNLFAVWFNRLVLGHHMLWGSNMAVRAIAWQAVAQDCSLMGDINEDLDTAMHINKRFGKRALQYTPHMRADISARRAMVSFWSGWRYLSMWPRTLSLHNRRARVAVWPVIALLVPANTAVNKMARFYNSSEDRMIFTLEQWRARPITNKANP